MSLSRQINLKILLSSLFILALGGAIAIWQARYAVDKEIDSSVNLTAHLITCGLSQARPNHTAWLNCFSSLKETRHLTIEIIKPTGETFGIGNKSGISGADELPPKWFINLIGNERARTESQITTSLGEQFSLRIQANPLDEIKEVWEESIAFLYSIVLLTQLIFLSVYLALNKTISSIKIIVDALKMVETGNYRQKLPEFVTAEYNSIARAINHMTAELNKAQQENRSLVQHSLEILENERKQLAMELHDELGQSLTAIKIMAITANRKKTEVEEITASIANICDSLIDVVRSIMQQLHPLVLTELGLKAAIEDLLNHWSTRNQGLKFFFQCPDEIDSLGQKITIQIFRVIQECFTNIIRHADATECLVELELIRAPENQIRLTIKDNGKGCQADKITKGFGILGMKERIHSLGGNLSIQSQPGKGVEVNVLIPIISDTPSLEYQSASASKN